MLQKKAPLVGVLRKDMDLNVFFDFCIVYLVELHVAEQLNKVASLLCTHISSWGVQWFHVVQPQRVRMCWKKGISAYSFTYNAYNHLPDLLQSPLSHSSAHMPANLSSQLHVSSCNPRKRIC